MLANYIYSFDYFFQILDKHTCIIEFVYTFIHPNSIHRVNPDSPRFQGFKDQENMVLPFGCSEACREKKKTLKLMALA